MSEEPVKRQEVSAPARREPTMPAVEPEPIGLRQIKIPLPCGATAVCIALQLKHRDNTYLIGAMPGWEGGGREADGALAPLVPALEYLPKYYDSATGALRAPWPWIEPTMRWINNGRVMVFRDCAVVRRLERAWTPLERTLRLMANLRQARLGNPSQDVSDTALIDLVKTRLKGM